MLRTVRDRLEKHYYDSTFHGIDLQASAAYADSQIQAATSSAQMFQAIAAFVQKLEDSHTTFVPPGLSATVEYGWNVRMVGDSAFVVAVDPQSDAADKGLKVGDRVLALDRYVMTRENLRLMRYAMVYLNPRPAVRFDIETADGTRRTLDIQAKITRRSPIRREIDLYREYYRDAPPPIAEYLELGKDVVIVRLGWFGDRASMDKVMRVARKAKTLVLDLRGNPGGSEDGLKRLVGHVFDKRITIGTLHTRHGRETLESTPVETPFAGTLMVLTDSRSGSSAEVFAYVVQLEGRGAVVGDRSAGAVMRSMLHRLAIESGKGVSYYRLAITDADLTMTDSTRLEGRGVTPDSFVLPSRDDLVQGHDPVLAMALTLAGYPTDRIRAGAMLPHEGKKRK